MIKSKKNHRGRFWSLINLNGCGFHSINKNVHLFMSLGSNIFNFLVCQNMPMVEKNQNLFEKLMLNNYHMVEVKIKQRNFIELNIFQFRFNSMYE